MSEALRAAMIGGGWITDIHLDALSRVAGVEPVAVMARTEATAQRSAGRWGLTPYTDVDALLDQERPDVAWVAVPTAAHGPIEHALLDRGVPFLVEKPLALDADVPLAISERIEEDGIVVAAGYNWRAIDLLAEVRELLAERPAKMVNGRWIAGTPPAVWWQQESQSGGQVVEQTTHLIDLARHLVGDAEVVSGLGSRTPREEYPDADFVDTTAALLQFEGGAIGTFTSTALLSRPYVIELELFCEGLAISIEVGGRWPSPVWSITVADEGGRTRREANADPYEHQDAVFLDAVRSGDPSAVLCTYQDALRSHLLALEVASATEVPAELASHRGRR